MQFIINYSSPIDRLLLACDEIGLTGLWMEGQKYYARGLAAEFEERETPVFKEAIQWLDLYFSGRIPDFLPPIHLIGSPFQLSVWEILQKIPYGTVTTYGEIAKKIAAERGLSHMSAQAVGGAVGHNPISVIVPCHRVVGTNGSLTGYAGGVEKKIKLLELEGADLSQLFVPKTGSAL